MDWWLISESARKRIVQNTQFYQHLDVEASRKLAETAQSRELMQLQSEGSEAVIRIDGILTKKPSFFAMLFGGGNTTYADIRAALQEARADDNIERVRFEIDSPGGMVDGLFETLDDIENAKSELEIRVLAESADSAAYAIAASAGPITASSRGSSFGSIGTLTTIPVSENLITITSSDARKKAPDPTTKEGVAIIQERLDALNALFVKAVAKGRDVTENTVRKKFGEGASLLAEEAKDLGMIDAIQGLSLVATKPNKEAAVDTGREETTAMTLEELKAKFPAVFQAVRTEGYDAGFEKGGQAEKDRCLAHLTLAEGSGATDLAIEAIKEGTEVTVLVHAQHLKHGMKSKDSSDAQKDGDDAASKIAKTKEPTTTGEYNEDYAKKMADELCGPVEA